MDDHFHPIPSDPPALWDTLRLLRLNSGAVFGGGLLFFALSLGMPRMLLLLRLKIPAFNTALSSLTGVPGGLLELALSVISLAVPCFVTAVVLEMPARAAFPLRAPRGGLLLAGIFCCLGMSAVGANLARLLSALTAWLFGAVPQMAQRMPPYGAAETAVYFLRTAAAPALLEELFFRGVVMQSLRRFGDGFALVASSILFACAHGNLVQAPNALLTGLVLGYFALRTGSVVTSMIMHFVNNAVAAGVSVSMLYLSPRVYEILSFAVAPLYLVLGFVGVVLMLTRNGGFLRPARVDCGLREGQKYARLFTTPLAVTFLVVAVYLTVLNFR